MRKRAGRISTLWPCLAVFSLALLLSVAMFLCISCGKTQEATEEKEQKSSQTSGEEKDNGQELTTQESSDTVSREGGNTEFSLEGQEIGEDSPFEWVKITDVSWSDQGDYIRIVFEMKHQDGSDLQDVPNVATTTTIGPGNDSYNIIAWFRSVRPSAGMEDPQFQVDEVPVALGDPNIETIEKLITGEGEGSAFAVSCAYSPAHPGISSRPHRLMYQTNPMRIILDIQKM